MSGKPFDHPLYEKLKTKKFLLCSTSPRRFEILTMMGIEDMHIYASQFPEDLNKDDYTPSGYVQNTALGKIMNVWDELKSKGEAKDVVLLAADTVVENEGNIYEKPKSIEDNARAIKELRDSKNPDINVLTGAVIMTDDASEPSGYKIVQFVENTIISVDQEMSDEFIDAYCKTEEGLTVAGGFRIQGYGGLMMTGIKGDYMNVVGLPMNQTFKKLCSILDCKY